VEAAEVRSGVADAGQAAGVAHRHLQWRSLTIQWKGINGISSGARLLSLFLIAGVLACKMSDNCTCELTEFLRQKLRSAFQTVAIS
jgi:hypothetical protein